jgi:hypothetical protein
VSLVKPTVKSVSRGVQQNLFCNFWTLLQVSMNFASLKQFLKFKIIKNDLKSPHSVGPKTGPRLQCVARRPATRGVVTRWTTTRWGLAGGKVLPREHCWGPGVVPGKKSGDEAHRGGRAAVGQWEVADAAVFRWEGSSDGVVASLGRSCR